MERKTLAVGEGLVLCSKEMEVFSQLLLYFHKPIEQHKEAPYEQSAQSKGGMNDTYLEVFGVEIQLKLRCSPIKGMGRT